MNYNKYTKSTKKKMKSVEDYLISTYGSVQDEWTSTLTLLADNLDLYDSCMEALNITGVFDKITWRKNPLLSTVKDIQATILKLIQHLGISPYAHSKIRYTPEDDTEDFIESLLGGGDDGGEK